MSQPVRRRGARGPLELRRLHSGVFRMGRFVGPDIRALLGFSEVGAHHPLRQRGPDLEEVLSDLVETASSRRAIQVRGNNTPKQTDDMGDWEP